MPRLRVVKKPEDSAKIPETEAVQVELRPEGEIETEVLETVDTAKKAEVKAPEAPSEEVVQLKKQLEDLKKANEQALATAADNDKRRREAQSQAEEHQKELAKVGGRAEQAEFDSILTALGAAQFEMDSAKRDLRASGEAGDWDKQADAQARIAQAAGRVMQLEDGKAAFESRREELKEERKTAKEPTQTNLTVDEYIDGLPNLMGAEKSWLKAHPELLTDKRKNARLQAAYFDAEDANQARGSESYFKFIEEKLGYRKAEVEADDEDVETETRSPVVSAPVSRESISPSSGKAVSTRITLNPQQREAAKLAGVDELTYARQLQKLAELKKEGHYSQN